MTLSLLFRPFLLVNALSLLYSLFTLLAPLHFEPPLMLLYLASILLPCFNFLPQ